MRRIVGIFLAFLFVFIPTFQGTAQTAPAVSAGSRLSGISAEAGFSIETRQGYKVLTVSKLWPGSASKKTYVLYPRGSQPPRDIKADLFVPVPVQRVVLYSTTYIPALETIGELDSVVGVDNAGFVYSPQLRVRIAAGKVVETTKNWMPDIERLVALKPDVIFNYGLGNEWDTFPKMQEVGLPVVLLGEWNEQDPLVRAEWAVFIAAFYNKEAEALARLETVRSEYARLKTLAAGAGSAGTLPAKSTAPQGTSTLPARPRVLVNGPFQGVWTVSGGQSYMARLIADAGGAYLWADNRESGGLSLSVEAVFERALGADVWLNPAYGAQKLADVKALDPRFSALPVLKKGNVWNNDRRMSPGGGNDYFESAVMNPHLVLADLTAIFHPELLPNHAFTYYRKIEE